MIQFRTLVVTATEDMVIPPENSSIFGERIPDARFVGFPNAGHGLMYRCPEKFAGSEGGFLIRNELMKIGLYRFVMDTRGDCQMICHSGREPDTIALSIQ